LPLMNIFFMVRPFDRAYGLAQLYLFIF